MVQNTSAASVSKAPIDAPTKPRPELPFVYPILFAFGAVLPLLGGTGRLWGGLLLAGTVAYMALLTLERKQQNYGFFASLGLFIAAEIVFRDYILDDVSYLVVPYVLIGLGAINFLALLRVMGSKPFRALTLPWLMLCVWGLLGLLVSLDPVKGRWFLSIYWGGLVCLGLVAGYATRRDLLDGLYDGIIMGAVLVLGLAMTLFLSSPRNFFTADEFRFGAVLVSPVQLGTVLGIGLLVGVIKLFHQRRGGLLTLIITAALGFFTLITFSRGPLFAMVAALAVFALLQKGSARRALFLVFAVVGGSILFNLLTTRFVGQFQSRFIELSDADARQYIWEVSLEMWRQNPVIGWGTGSWKLVYEDNSWLVSGAPESISDAHNILFQSLAEMGLVGAALMGLFLLNFGTGLLRRRSAAAAALFVCAVLIGLVANWKVMAIYLALALAAGEMWLDRRAENQGQHAITGAAGHFLRR
jgi:O-antigen ligase